MENVVNYAGAALVVKNVQSKVNIKVDLTVNILIGDMRRKMTDYKCGHKSGTIIIDSTPVTLSSYLTWKESTGFDGDKTECFDCYCKRVKKND